VKKKEGEGFFSAVIKDGKEGIHGLTPFTWYVNGRSGTSKEKRLTYYDLPLGQGRREEGLFWNSDSEIFLGKQRIFRFYPQNPAIQRGKKLAMRKLDCIYRTKREKPNKPKKKREKKKHKKKNPPYQRRRTRRDRPSVLPGVESIYRELQKRIKGREVSKETQTKPYRRAYTDFYI